MELMLSLMQSAILGGLQGIAELFPISSLGHSVIIPALLGWNIDQQDPSFLLFLVATHLATALVLFGFYWHDWMQIISGIIRSLREREIRESDTYAKIGWLLIVSTIPAGLLGLLFQTQIQTYLISPIPAACFLALNGFLLYGAEILRKRARVTQQADTAIAHLSFQQGIIVGSMQALALFPGLSRTGASLSGGLLVGLSHEDAVRFSFLLATPIIAAAAVLKLPELFHSVQPALIESVLIGSLAAAIFAYLSVKFLTRYFHLENRTLTPFAIYCFVAGVGSLAYLYFV